MRQAPPRSWNGRTTFEAKKKTNSETGELSWRARRSPSVGDTQTVEPLRSRHQDSGTQRDPCQEPRPLPPCLLLSSPVLPSLPLSLPFIRPILFLLLFSSSYTSCSSSLFHPPSLDSPPFLYSFSLSFHSAYLPSFLLLFLLIFLSSSCFSFFTSSSSSTFFSSTSWPSSSSPFSPSLPFHSSFLPHHLFTSHLPPFLSLLLLYPLDLLFLFSRIWSETS